VSIVGQSRPEESSVYLKTIIAALAVGLFPSLLMSQSMPTAVRRLNVQVGGLFSVANPGVASDATIVYGQMNFKGGGMYATIDPANHLGLEMSVRQVFGTEGVHERTYSAGPRFYLTRGRFMPYGKVLFGRAVFNFPNNFANQAFTEGSLGGGVDYRLTSLLYVRADYEYQRWFSFGTQVSAFPGSLSPSVASFGVSYHFGGNADCECGRY
jgi:opacity protein-like surface antigen